MRGTAIESSPCTCAPARAQPQHLDADDARHFLGHLAHARRQALGGGIDQRVDGALPEPEAGDGDEESDRERSDGISLLITVTRRHEPEQHDDRGEEITRKMQGIGSERIASRRLGDSAERQEADGIDQNGDDQDREDGPAGLDRLGGMTGEPPRRLDEHADREHQQKAGFGERGDRLDLAVTVMVLLVGGLVGPANGEIGERRDAGVEQPVAGFRQQRERSRQQARDRACRGRGGRSPRSKPAPPSLWSAKLPSLLPCPPRLVV